MNMGMYLDGRRALRSASISNVAAGGSIGSVDNYDAVLINQTTAAKVLTFATPTVNEFRKLVAANVGSAGFYAYGRFISPGSSDEFVYIPSVGWRRTASGPQIIYQSWASPTNVPADTAENTVLTFTIPGGVIGDNGGVRVLHKWDYTNSANSKTMRMRISGSVIGAVTTTTSAHIGAQMDFHNKNSASSQVGSNGAGVGTSGTSALTTSIDTSADFTLTLTGQKASAGETLTYLGATIILDRFD